MAIASYAYLDMDGAWGGRERERERERDGIEPSRRNSFHLTCRKAGCSCSFAEDLLNRARDLEYEAVYKGGRSQIVTVHDGAFEVGGVSEQIPTGWCLARPAPRQPDTRGLQCSKANNWSRRYPISSISSTVWLAAVTDLGASRNRMMPLLISVFASSFNYRIYRSSMT